MALFNDESSRASIHFCAYREFIFSADVENLARASHQVDSCIHHCVTHKVSFPQRKNYYTKKKLFLFFFQCDKNTRETLFVEWSSKSSFFLFRFFLPAQASFFSVRADNKHDFALVLTRRSTTKLLLDCAQLSVHYSPCHFGSPEQRRRH